MVIKGRYYIADCEHNGDIDRARNYITSLGGEVYSSHWDGCDCGEAYLEIGISPQTFVKVYKSYSFQMDADINDFISLGWGDTPKREFDELMKKFKQGGTDRIPLYLFFNFKTSKEDADKVLTDILGILGDGAEVEATSSAIKCGYKYYYALLTADSITKEQLRSIGDFAAFNPTNSYMKRNRLFGEIDCLRELN